MQCICEAKLRPEGLLLPSPAQLQQQNPENLSHQGAFGHRQVILLTGVALSLVLQDPFSLSKWVLDPLIEKGGTWWHWGRFALTLELAEVHAYLQALALQLYPLLHQTGVDFQGYGMVLSGSLHISTPSTMFYNARQHK